MKFKINNNEWEIKEISNAEMNIIAPSDNEKTFTHGETIYRDLTIYINKETKEKKKTLYHELMHCLMYEYGHNQNEKEFNCEDVCEISACTHDTIHRIVEKYFKEK